MRKKMKTIKMIDLLNKLANGEEVPNRIKFHRDEYEYKKINGYGCYYDVYRFNDDMVLGYSYYLDRCLNDDVEIIDETKGSK